MGFVDEWKGSYAPYQQDGGFCLAMCQYWVSQRMRHIGGDELIKKLNQKEVLDRIKARHQLIKEKSYKIPGAEKHKISPERGREALLTEVLATRGFYVYGVYSDSTPPVPGHAIAFDISSDHLYFFDPNFGQFWFEKFDGNTETEFRTWFHKYCDEEKSWSDDEPGDSPTSYKDRYSGGKRKLRRYTLSDCSSLLT